MLGSSSSSQMRNDWRVPLNRERLIGPINATNCHVPSVPSRFLSSLAWWSIRIGLTHSEMEDGTPVQHIQATIRREFKPHEFQHFQSVPGQFKVFSIIHQTNFYVFGRKEKFLNLWHWHSVTQFLRMWVGGGEEGWSWKPENSSKSIFIWWEFM